MIGLLDQSATRTHQYSAISLNQVSHNFSKVAQAMQDPVFIIYSVGRCEAWPVPGCTDGVMLRPWMCAQSVPVSSSHLARCQTHLGVIQQQSEPRKNTLKLNGRPHRRHETIDGARAPVIELVVHLHFTIQAVTLLPQNVKHQVVLHLAAGRHMMYQWCEGYKLCTT